MPPRGSAGLAPVGRRAAAFLVQRGARLHARQSWKGDRATVARRAVDRLDDPYILEALHPGRLRRPVFADRAREVVDRHRDFVSGLEVELLPLAAPDEREARARGGVVGARDADPAFLTVHGELRDVLLAEAGVQMREPLVGEADE